MGTSSSYGGPTGGKRLLPAWAQEGDSPEDILPETDLDKNNDNEDPNSPIQPNDVPKAHQELPKWVNVESWRAPKKNMRRFVSEKGRSNLIRASRTYVKAKGGARNAALSAVVGRAATHSFGRFLADIARHGINEAINKLGLQHIIGRSVEDVFAAIAEVLAPPGASLEEHAARRAINDALAGLFEEYCRTEFGLEKLNEMDSDGVKEAIENSISGYIYQRWLQELGDRIEKHALSAQEAVRLEREIQDFVMESVKLDLSNLDILGLDWGSKEAQAIIENIYTEAYSILEVIE